MKALIAPNIPDFLNLRRLSRNNRLSSFPALRGRLNEIAASYIAYRRANGSRISPAAPAPLAIPIQLADALRGHYTRPPTSLAQDFDNLRETGSPEICPMCGSLGTGTLDHVFPKSQFPELAVFSKNLVPACICNSKRRDNAAGAGIGERVLHPYYDAFLNQRLIRANIIPSDEHGFERPHIDLLILLDPADVNFAAVQYHVNNVIRPTQVLAHCDTMWIKFTRRPETFFLLPPGPVTDVEFENAVIAALERADDKLESPNNWESMLFAGVRAAPDAMAFLRQRLLDLRNDVVAPEDV